MFKFLKEKLKGAIGKFSKDVEKEADVEEIEKEPQETLEETIKEESVEEKEEISEEKEEKEESNKDEEPAEETKKEVDEETKETTKEQPKEEKKPAKKKEKPIKVKEIIKGEDEPVPLVETITIKEKEEEKKEDPTEEKGFDEEKEETSKTKEEEEPQEEKKKGFFGKLFKKKEKIAEEEKTKEADDEEKEETSKTKEEEEPQDKEKEETKEADDEEKEEKPKKEGFFTKLTKVKLSKEKFENIFWELEIALLENNVAVEVIEKIKEDLQEALTQEKISRKGIEELITDTLKQSITEILDVKKLDLLKEAEKKKEEGKPLIITMIGVNGSGKTTTLAKLINYFQKNDKSVVVAASDTFRAAAIQQLEEHTTKLGVKLIKQDYNADPAAVAFDAIKHATAKGLDIVLIDSAGRLHSNDNLMNELKKLIRVNKPDINIFVGEAITGNDCIEQAKLFDEAVGIDGIILAKADVDEKGGAAISATHVTGKPVLFLGTGQTYDDLEPFNAQTIIDGLGL